MKTQWEIYQKLELIPETVLSPLDERGISGFYKSKIWRSLVIFCVNHLSEQQTFNHIEGCFEIDSSAPNSTKRFHFFKTIWIILNQPIQLSDFSNKSEPYIWKSSNVSGFTQWHIYDPKSGLTHDLDSEEDVLIWLKKRDFN